MTCQKKKECGETGNRIDQTKAVTRINGSECSIGKDHVTISKETVSK